MDHHSDGINQPIAGIDSLPSSGSGEIGAESQGASIGTPTERGPRFAGIQTTQVSNTFNYNARLDPAPPNTVIVTSDEIFFVVHRHKLSTISTNLFGNLLAAQVQQQDGIEPNVLPVPESSNVLNVVLHCLYGLSCDEYNPTLECIEQSLEAMRKYGLTPLHLYVSRDKPLYNTILKRATLHPIETYALAGANDLEDLASACSAYALQIKIHLISAELAQKMTAPYYVRLAKLQATRLETLKNLLDEPVEPHTPKPYCSADQKQVVDRAYSLAAAQIFYHATPGLNRVSIETVMDSLIASIQCVDCKEALNAHVHKLVRQWTQLKRTI